MIKSASYGIGVPSYKGTLGRKQKSLEQLSLEIEKDQFQSDTDEYEYGNEYIFDRTLGASETYK